MSSKGTKKREVERKFPISPVEFEMLPGKLTDMAFVSGGAPTRQVDIYLPSAPDDTRRLRTETCGDDLKLLFTQKVPGPGKDGMSARIETERKITSEEHADLLAEGTAEGDILTVDKLRTTYVGRLTVVDREFDLSIGLDSLANLGPDGSTAYFLEAECLLDADSDEGMISQLLQFLDLFVNMLLGEVRAPEKLSYKKLAVKAAKAREETT